LSPQQIDRLCVLCQQYTSTAKSEKLKTALGKDYVNPALKGHYVEVHLPEFAKQFHLTGL
jgi:hypothetical protein